MPFFMVASSSWPVTWRTDFSGDSCSTAVNGVLAVWAKAGMAARTATAMRRRMLETPFGASGPVFEDQVGEGVTRRGGKDVRHAGRDHQPVAGLQDLEFAAHQL